MGAEVIQIERPGLGDIGWRTLGIRLETADGSPPVATNWIQERRNIFCVSLDLSKPQGRDLFLKLAARAEIWMESSKPGTYPRFGLDDEACSRSTPNSSSPMFPDTARVAIRTISIALLTTSWARPSAV